MKKPYWRGVFPAITTQMKKDGALDLDATARHATALIQSGVAGVIFLGSLGENQSLSADEKRRVIEAMVEAVNGRVPALSGVAESSTVEACRYARDCERLGLDGFMLMPPMAYKSPDGSGIAFPDENQYFWELTRRGKWDQAREIYRWFTPLLHLDTHPKFVQYIKLAVQECELGAEWTRPPRLALVGEERRRILKVIHDGMAKRPKVARGRASSERG